MITSATLDGEKFSAYFGECPVMTVPGRVFEVQVVHSKENHDRDLIGAAVDAALQIHLQEDPGDILVFLAGQAEIDKVGSVYVKSPSENLSYVSDLVGKLLSIAGLYWRVDRVTTSNLGPLPS